MPRLGGLLVLSLSLHAAADAPPEPRDAHGDPLPPGAVARLGATRFRAEGVLDKVACTPDGAVVVSAGSAGLARVRPLLLAALTRLRVLECLEAVGTAASAEALRGLAEKFKGQPEAERAAAAARRLALGR